ncbi:alpha-galactosidase [Maritalea mediterranea]|uniref:Alpha-galactosidase n=1 Tax=Maritalea mediterranea TaxID=2909667 RepID=A0ABS9E8A3_9HYPH|nr:alpha-galactosidase [Maritalea mediterranea]MCF4098129.1 alpha-galactosidase [Maritalea mediterranea]
MIQTWRLDVEQATLVLARRGDRMVEIVYLGAPLPADADLDQIVQATQRDVTGGMLDQNLPLTICPELGESIQGHAGLKLNGPSGQLMRPTFSNVQVHQMDARIEIEARDQQNGLTFTATLAAHASEQVFYARAALKTSEPCRLSWLSAPVVTGFAHTNGILDFTGRWCGEFIEQSTPWRAGAHMRDNPTGRSGHEHFPGAFVLGKGATNNQGEAYGFHYAWSGGHCMIAEQLPDGQRQLQFGHALDSYNELAMEFETAPLYFTYTADQGLNGCAIAFQRLVKANLKSEVRDEVRPVHYNCWEAVYFDHKLEQLKHIANKAAALGAERFVLDDGWFGNRNDDTSSLGDWQVDPKKFPDGLTPLIEYVRGLNMQFGLWVEPEMVNANSALYRAHPEWLLGPADQLPGRHQFVLDMALEEVQDYLFDQLSALLNQYEISYLKWDHNRVLPFKHAAQTEGTYALLARLNDAFPKLVIESCASGGGRLDYGILQHTQRVWLSDSNDALERAKIQHNAALFLPAAVTGSHVGPRICHTSGRQIDMQTRAWVAAQRHMGFEMDPDELTDEEAATLAAVTAWWQNNREWMLDADLLRLDGGGQNILSELHLARDKGRFVLFANKIDTSDTILETPIRLARLEADAHYKIEIVNHDQYPHLSRSDLPIKNKALTLPGSFLCQTGIQLPWNFPGRVSVIEGIKV